MLGAAARHSYTTRVHIKSITALVLAAIITLIGAGCSSRRTRRHDDRATLADTLPAWDAESFARNTKLARRVIAAPVAEIVAKLGSFEFRARSQFSFVRGTRSNLQADQYEADVDSEKNFRVKIVTGDTQVEAIVVGEEMFVRQNLGHLRRKPQRDPVAWKKWTELAWSSQLAAIEPFFSRLLLERKEESSHDGRDVLVYSIALGDETEKMDTNRPQMDALPRYALPVAAPTAWRENAHLLDLAGELWFDRATGVLVKTKLEGRIEVRDQDVHPTQLRLRYDGALKRIGRVEPLSRPHASRPEYVRVPRPVDPLSFFRKELPQPEDLGDAEQRVQP